MPTILVADDEPNISQMIACALKPHGYEVETADDGPSAIEKIRSREYDLVLTDVVMPGATGFAVLSAALQRPNPPPVIVMTGFGSIRSAIEAIKCGATDYLTKPLDLAKLTETIGNVIRDRKGTPDPTPGSGGADSAGDQVLKMAGAASSTEELRRLIEDKTAMIGRSGPMDQLYRLIDQVARASATVMVLGASGTGKELVARAIHQLSPRAAGPFVAIDCGSLPETILESELFGHVAGAFTGAVEDKTGLFEAANGGTLFLDEVGELTPRVQQKLLRTIQERAVRPVGSTTLRKVDVRIISATNRDLQKLVAEKAFRQDLYYRLNVVPIPVPTLAERREDIPLLAAHFVRKYARRIHRKTPSISETVMTMLSRAEWPGNVRQLENVIECAVTFSEGDEIRPEHLPPDFIESFALSKTVPRPVPVAEVEVGPVAEGMRTADITPLGAAIRYLERQMLSKALDASHGNKEVAATLLGIDRATLYRKLKTHNLADTH